MVGETEKIEAGRCPKILFDRTYFSRRDCTNSYTYRYCCSTVQTNGRQEMAMTDFSYHFIAFSAKTISNDIFVGGCEIGIDVT